MPRLGAKPESSALLPMAMIAVALHVLLLTQKTLWFEPTKPPSSEPVWIELFHSSSLVPPADPPAQTQLDQSTPIDPPQNYPPATADASQPVWEGQANQPKPAQARPTESARRLREQVLIAAEAQSPWVASEPALSDGFRIPRLPGATGWLNDYVGAVEPRMDQWQNADGSQNMRVVRGSGQVLCGRRRAPTMAEEFNPWMSAAVTLWRDCGRAHPETVDRKNPWIRGKGRSNH